MKVLSVKLARTLFTLELLEWSVLSWQQSVIQLPKKYFDKIVLWNLESAKKWLQLTPSLTDYRTGGRVPQSKRTLFVRKGTGMYVSCCACVWHFRSRAQLNEPQNWEAGVCIFFHWAYAIAAHKKQQCQSAQNTYAAVGGGVVQFGHCSARALQPLMFNGVENHFQKAMWAGAVGAREKTIIWQLRHWICIKTSWNLFSAPAAPCSVDRIDLFLIIN